MRLLDDVHLIGSEVWPRPPSERSSARAQGQQVVNLANLEDSFAVVHGSMTSLAENCEKWLSCWARVRPVSA